MENGSRNKGKNSNKRTYSDSSSSVSSRISTRDITNIVEQLKLQQHRDSTKENYYTVWKLFNKFFIRLDFKPRAWEDRLTLFVGYLINDNKQSSTVKSYISAIKAVLRMHGIKIEEDQYLLSSLTRACRLKNDKFKARMPIRKSMLAVLMHHTKIYFENRGQPFLALLYQTILSTMYYGLFRIGEVTKGTHPVLAKDVHIAKNKRKILFILRSSKTHDKSKQRQMVIVSSSAKGTSIKKKSAKNKTMDGMAQESYSGKSNRIMGLPCPYQLLRCYLTAQGGFCKESELFFIFRDGTPVSHSQFNRFLKLIIKTAGFL